MIMTSWEERGFNKGIEKREVDDILKIIQLKFGTFPENIRTDLEKVKNLESLFCLPI